MKEIVEFFRAPLSRDIIPSEGLVSASSNTSTTWNHCSGVATCVQDSSVSSGRAGGT